MFQKIFILFLLSLNTFFSFAISSKQQIKNSLTFILQEDSVITLKDTSKNKNSEFNTFNENNYIGYICKLENKDFIKGNLSSPEKLIKGLVPGLLISDISGAPGSFSEVTYRGSNTIFGNSTPLIIIDGFPIVTSNFSDYLNPTDIIHPSNIESISFISDASILDFDNGNGAIIIKSKKADRNQPLSLSYSGNISLSTLSEKYDVLNVHEFRTIINERYADNENILSLLGNAETDWQDVIFRNSISTNQHLNISKYLKKINTPVTFSYGYRKNNGILETSSLQRNNLALNLQPSFFKDHLKLLIDVKKMYSKGSIANEQAIKNAALFDPTQTVYEADEYFFYKDSSGNRILYAPVNPLALLEMRKDSVKNNHSLYNFGLNYKFHFLPNLNFTAKYSIHKTNFKESVSYPYNYPSYYYGDVRKEGVSDTLTNKLFKVSMQYHKRLKKLKSEINLILRYNDDNTTKKYYTYSKIENTNLNSYYSRIAYSVNSKVFFGIFNLNITDKYFLNWTTNINRLIYSRNNSFLTNQYIGLAWKLSNEKFMSNIHFIKNLKLYINYKSFSEDYLSIVRQTDPFSYIHPEIKVPKKKGFETGLSFNILKNKISGTIGFYKYTKKDMIIPIIVPPNSFFSNIYINAGEIQNKGTEININSIIINKKHLKWEFRLNHTYLKNVFYNNSEDLLYFYSETIKSYPQLYIQMSMDGYPVNSFFVYKQIYNKNQEPLENTYVDFNRDGNIYKYDDSYLYKSQAPDHVFGFNSYFMYHNFSFYISGRVHFGNYVYNYVASSTSSYYSLKNYYSFNNITDYYHFELNGFQNQQYFSDYYIENASFFKIDNISFAYNIPNKKKYSAEISFNIQSAFKFTNYSDIDPEVPSGIDYFRYPVPRIFSVGINLNI